MARSLGAGAQSVEICCCCCRCGRGGGECSELYGRHGGQWEKSGIGEKLEAGSFGWNTEKLSGWGEQHSGEVGGLPIPQDVYTLQYMYLYCIVLYCIV